jgi:hypothetical protein
VFDHDGYPTEESLTQLRKWPYTDVAGWLEHARALWYYPEAATVEGKRYRFATGGWSGNEDVIGAMRDNHMLWMLCWESSHRGGLYYFVAGDEHESVGAQRPTTEAAS